MGNKLFCVAVFAVGAVTGAAATWQYFKTKYEKIAQEEIESVKKMLASKSENKEEKVEEVDDYTDVKSVDGVKAMTDYKQILKQYDYAGRSKAESKKEDKGVEKPYVITPDEFGELDDYECISLTFYADGYLTDDMDVLIDDIDEVVGHDSLSHFGEYEDDSVFVRNDVRKCDYEILMDQRNYADIIEKNDWQ